MMRKNGKSKKTGIFGLRNKIYLCFLVPIVFMIVVGMVSYRYAEDGLSQNIWNPPSRRPIWQQIIWMSAVPESNPLRCSMLMMQIWRSIFWGCPVNLQWIRLTSTQIRE